jgi:glycogen synthase
MQGQMNNGHRVNVAHFSWEYPPTIWGGLGTFATELTLKQSQLGHNVNVFAINDKNKSKIQELYHGVKVNRPTLIDTKDSLSMFINNDLQSWGSNLSFFSTVFEYNLFSAKTLIDQINQQQSDIDIIEGHDWLGILGGIMAKRSLSIPLIFHIHSTEQGRSLGHGSPTIQQIERQGADFADGVTTVSYAMKLELEQLGYPKEKIRVCWNGIDPDKYCMEKIPKEKIASLRNRYGINENEVFLFFIGRLVSVKGIRELIQAMPAILENHPNVKLVALGVGDLEQELKETIKFLKIENNVIFRTEFVPEDERILHYAASDIVVLPSLYEPFGIVCTEAMSMGKPVVVGARGINGMKEQVISDGDQQCGVHINPYDPADIAWGITLLLDSPDSWKWIGDNGRKRVFEFFTWEHVAKRSLEIYNEFIL